MKITLNKSEIEAAVIAQASKFAVIAEDVIPKVTLKIDGDDTEAHIEFISTDAVVEQMDPTPKPLDTVSKESTIVEEDPKPKRKRRTKAEIEAAKAEAETNETNVSEPESITPETELFDDSSNEGTDSQSTDEGLFSEDVEGQSLFDRD